MERSNDRIRRGGSILIAVVLASLLRASTATGATLSIGGGATGTHAAMIGADGRAWLWGTGWGYPPVPADISNVTAVASSDWSTNCYLRSDGTVWCSGDLPYLDGTEVTGATPYQVLNIDSPVSEISSGYDSSCAVTIGGAIWCWGRNAFGKLGLDASLTGAFSPTELALQTVAHAVAGKWSTCAIKTDGTLWCWGLNSSGELGDGTTTSRSAAGQVAAAGSDVAGVAIGEGFVCARKTTGTVWCWGRNDVGQLGTGTTVGNGTPQQVSGLGTVVQVAASGAHACALIADGTIWCWGGNNEGELGTGATNGSTIPVQVAGMGSATEISLSAYDSCARTINGNIWCWGSPGQTTFGAGTLQSDGTNASPPSGLLPVLVPGFPAAVSVSASGPHSRAALAFAVLVMALRAGRGKRAPGRSSGANRCAPRASV